MHKFSILFQTRTRRCFEHPAVSMHLFLLSSWKPPQISAAPSEEALNAAADSQRLAACCQVVRADLGPVVFSLMMLAVSSLTSSSYQSCNERTIYCTANYRSRGLKRAPSCNISALMGALLLRLIGPRVPLR